MHDKILYSIYRVLKVNINRTGKMIMFKAGPLRLKQLTNALKKRILSETSILYSIRYASIILIEGLRL